MAVAVADAVPLTAGLTQEEQFINGLAQGGAWTFSGGPRELAYSLHTDGGPWSVASAAALIQAFQAWADVADLDFRLIISAPETELSSAELAITLISDPFTDSSDTAGIGIFPDPVYADGLLSEVGISRVDYPNPEGDLFFYTRVPDFNHVQPGGRGFADYLHEIGHVLGLKHPHDDGGNPGRPTFAETGMSADDAWDYDSGYWTLMSYYDPDTGSPGLESGYQATPMPLDILVIQHIYGANMSHNTGDDTYRLSADGQVKTIWDAGGSDTLDVSGLGQGTLIDLYPGALIEHGARSVTAIAFNVSIENAIGTAFADEIWGNDADNRLEGRDGNDTLAGGLGSDTLIGGRGDDDYYLSEPGDTVIELPDAGDDTVFVPFSHTLAGSHVENIYLDEGGDFDATGNELSNWLAGNSGANVLTGGPGDDFYVIDALDTLVELPGEGLDTVLSKATFSLTDMIENLILDGAGNADASGNRLDNILVGNTGNNVLNGGRGWDVLDGDAGNDTYWIDQPGDRLSEAGNAGQDTVIASISHALAANFETLTLAEAAGNLDGIGNALANTLTGNAGSNSLDGGAGDDALAGLGGDDVLLGGAGNDSLAGGLGQDLLTGGAGNDHFLFDTPAGIGGNADVISDFTKGQDKLVFNNDHYSALGAAGSLGAGRFLAGAGVSAQDADDHLLYDTGTGELYFDSDGAGFDPALLIATLTGKPALAATDILVGE
jgi:Ca2+-binding RTX toxin-like protein